VIGEVDLLWCGRRKLRAIGRSSRLVAAIGVFTIALGCGTGNDAASRIAAANDSNVLRLSNLYQAYRLRNDAQGPKDQAELTTYLRQNMDPTRLERMGVDPNDLEGLFVSDRDGQPLVIRYAVPGGLGAVDAVVFEKEGLNGKRQVGFTDGSVEEVEADRYEQLLQGTAQRAAGAR
jgi:hypothetical protein